MDQSDGIYNNLAFKTINIDLPGAIPNRLKLKIVFNIEGETVTVLACEPILSLLIVIARQLANRSPKRVEMR